MPGRRAILFCSWSSAANLHTTPCIKQSNTHDADLQRAAETRKEQSRSKEKRTRRRREAAKTAQMISVSWHAAQSDIATDSSTITVTA